MCLVTRQRKPKILKKDLKVYKLLKEGNFSPFNSFRWNKTNLYKTMFCIQKGNGKDMCFADGKSKDKYFSLSQCTEISEGFHACVTMERAEELKIGVSWIICTINEFLIPKGSEVYYDCTGLVVANQMMML